MAAACLHKALFRGAPVSRAPTCLCHLPTPGVLHLVLIYTRRKRLSLNRSNLQPIDVLFLSTDRFIWLPGYSQSIHNGGRPIRRTHWVISVGYPVYAVLDTNNFLSKFNLPKSRPSLRGPGVYPTTLRISLLKRIFPFFDFWFSTGNIPVEYFIFTCGQFLLCILEFWLCFVRLLAELVHCI